MTIDIVAHDADFLPPNAAERAREAALQALRADRSRKEIYWAAQSGLIGDHPSDPDGPWCEVYLDGVKLQPNGE